MMNAAVLIDEQIKARPRQTALWFPDRTQISFQELDELSRRIARSLEKAGIGIGDKVLLALGLSPLLYAAILAMTRLGITIMVVEPWMPLSRIKSKVELMKPKAFLAGQLGFFWGLRSESIRKIPHWLKAEKLMRESPAERRRVDVPFDQASMVTFTSGTSAEPKGVVRTHSYLLSQFRVISESLHTERFRGPDICIFPSFALANLGQGRSSLIIAGAWQPQKLRALDLLPPELLPETAVCGPAFLAKLMQQALLPGLKSLHVGGALSDCDLFEAAISKWPGAEIEHIYGSTEVEPVASGSARAALARSRAKGLFQVLELGSPHPELQVQPGKDQLWISGSHVCPEYLGNSDANQQFKKRAADGTLWHRMGDRVEVDGKNWSYAGRDSQLLQDFRGEQTIYSILGHSRAFLERDSQSRLSLYGEGLKPFLPAIKSALPELGPCFETRIKRDRRHRARIARDSSQRGLTWRVG